MRVSRIATLTGTAAVLLAGYAGIASAQSPQDPSQTPLQAHVMLLRLPNGQIEQVRYLGNVPPTVILAPSAMTVSADQVSPFAMLERMSADMDRQAAALFRNINTMGAPNAVGFGIIPAMSGPGVCSRSVQITFSGDHQAPHVVSQTTGDCGPARAQSAPVALPDTLAPHPVPALIEARAETRDPG